MSFLRKALMTVLLVFLYHAAFNIICVSGRQSPGTYFPLPETEGGWRKNTSTEFTRSLNIDPDKLEAFGSYNLSVKNGNWEPYSRYKGILFIRNGWIIGEWYNTPEARTFKTYISSNGKAFATVMFGIMAEDSRTGKIDLTITPDSAVYDRKWLPEGFPLSDLRKDQITFEQIFRHTSGLCPERDATGAEVEKGRNKWSDYVDWVVGHDMKWPQTGKLYFTPGYPDEYDGTSSAGNNRIAYSSVGYCHIGLVMRNVYGITAHEVLWNRLLDPLGFSGIDFHAPPNDDIRWLSAGGVRMSPRDYARFAYFLLRDGLWNNDRIVPPEWIEKFRTSDLYPNIRSNIDGYFGEHYPKDMFQIAGSGLNWAFIIPSLDIIALRTGRASNAQWDEVQDEFLRHIFAVVSDYEPTNEVKGGHDSSNVSQYLPGQIIVDPDNPRWLKRYGGGQFFMAGPGDPEDFLYRGTSNPDGTRSGDQPELIDKLKNTGANCIYLMAVRSHGGDGDETHNPFVDNDPAKGVNEKVLDQWENWFEEMDRNGIVIYFFLYDDDASVWDTGDVVGDGEKRFIHTLVNRFEHHKNLVWCIAEEYQEAFSVARVSAIAAEIRAADDHDHAIAVHKLHGLDFSEFADDPNIDQFAIQYNVSTPDSLHQGMVEAWKKADGKFSLNMSEAANYGTGAELRKKIWACAMAGAYVMILRMDIASTPESDLKACGNLVRFFESTDYTGMSPHDKLGYGGTEYVLVRPGKNYIAYASDLKGAIGIRDMVAGTYMVRWHDCASGKEVIEEISVNTGDQSWRKPKNLGNEIAVYISRTAR